MSRTARLLTMGALTALVFSSTVATASAKRLEREKVHESSSEVFEEFCGDLTVRYDVAFDRTLAAGSSKYYGPDGKLLLRDPGQIRFELLIDHGGTPTDPSDDEEIDFLGVVKGSTGRNDTEGRDFCDDVHEFIG